MLVVSARSAKSKTGSAKIPSGQDKEETDRFEMSKENIRHCSPHSLFEKQSGRGTTVGVRGKSGGEKKATRSAVHPRKRSFPESRLSAPASTSRGRELTPPELTTSDNFKPAKRVVGPKPALVERKKLTPVKAGVPPSPAAPSSAKLVPRLSIPADDRNFDSNSPRLGTSANRNSSTARKSSVTGRRLSVIRLSVSKEKGASVSPREKESKKKVMAFSAKSAGQQTTLSVQQKDVENARSKVTEKKAASGSKYPVPSGNPSNPVKPVTVAKDESATKTRLVARQSASAKAVAENTRTRKLSMVLQSEQRLQEQNQTLELQLRQLQETLIQKDNEIERLRSAGLILNNLAKNQSDEVRDLKFRLKETFNENADVRDMCEKLVKERQEELAARRKAKGEELNGRTVETQLDSLTVQLQNMGVGPLQSGKELPCSESSGRTNEEGLDDEVEEATFEVHSEVQEDFGSKVDAGDSESETPIGAGTVRKWSEVADEVTEDVPVRRHPEVPLKQEMSSVGYHEELLAAVRAVQDVHDAEDSGLSDSMRNELEVIGDLQSALKVISDLHPAAEALLIP